MAHARCISDIDRVCDHPGRDEINQLLLKDIVMTKIIEHGLKTTPFPFEGSQLRTVARDGEPWFVAVDVCDALGLDRTQIRRLDDDERGVCSIHTLGGA